MNKVITQTENEFKKKQQEVKERQIKEIVQGILEKLEDIKEDIKKLSEKKKALETSLDDLKSGRLDKLAELLDKNPVAKEVVRIEIHKEYVPYPVKEYVPYTPWNQPWVIQSPLLPIYGDVITCQAQSGCTYTAGDVKNAAIGTYTLTSGSVSIR